MDVHGILRQIIIDELLEENPVNIVNNFLNNVEELVAPENGLPERERPVRITNFYEVVVPMYSLDDFKKHFRMSRGTFEIILQQLVAVRDVGVMEGVPFEKKVLATIWILAKPESFLSVADRFNLPSSTLHGVFFEIIGILCNMRETVILWPNPIERRRISNASGGGNSMGWYHCFVCSSILRIAVTSWVD